MQNETIILFYTVTEVFKAEKALSRLGVTVRIVPVPRHLSSDCGVAISIFGISVEDVKRLLEEAAIHFAGISKLTG